MLASIPSPSFSVFHIGPLAIHIYGIIMGIAVATAFVVVTSRYEKLGGDRKVAESAGFWCIVIGFIGARLAFVLPGLGDPHEHWYWFIEIWKGGIALFGGLTFGTVTAVFVVRRRGGDFWMFADAAAVALPAAQAIGRWGNYFNQELFGTPTSLPWGLRIDPENRPTKYLDAETFHPTFLYEMLWNIGIIVLLLWLERHRKLRRGVLLGLYAVLYAVGRFLLELIRTDSLLRQDALSRYWGLTRNGWYSLLVILVGGGLLVWLQRRKPAPVEEPTPEDATAEEAAAEEPAADALHDEAVEAGDGAAAAAEGGDESSEH